MIHVSRCTEKHQIAGLKHATSWQKRTGLVLRLRCPGKIHPSGRKGGMGQPRAVKPAFGATVTAPHVWLAELRARESDRDPRPYAEILASLLNRALNYWARR